MIIDKVKKELIKLDVDNEKATLEYILGFTKGIDKSIDVVNNHLVQVVPEFIKDWLDEQKNSGDYNPVYEINCIEEKWFRGYELTEEENRVYLWHKKNKYKFFNACINGYMIENKFKIGEYYKVDYVGSTDFHQVFKVTDFLSNNKYVKHECFNLYKKELDFGVYSFEINSSFAEEAVKATEEDIKMFELAKMYYKHGRKFEELKNGDIIRYADGAQWSIQNANSNHVKAIASGECELYVTIEAIEKAYKETNKND